MKSKLIFFLILFLSFVCNTEEIGKVVDDQLLKTVIHKLPDGWQSRFSGDFLFIERVVPIFILYENRINAPFEVESILSERIKKYGIQQKARFVFWVDEKWSSDKIKEVEQQNQLIRREMDCYMDQYNKRNTTKINPRAKFLPEQNDPEYIQCKAALENLQKDLKPVPDYQSEKFALFLVEITGYEDEYHRIDPAGLYKELQLIETFFEKNLDKVSNKYSRVPMKIAVP